MKILRAKRCLPKLGGFPRKPHALPSAIFMLSLASDPGSLDTEAWQARANSPHVPITTSSHRGRTAGLLLFSTGRIGELGNMKKGVLKKSTKCCTNAGTTVLGETAHDLPFSNILFFRCLFKT